MDIARWTAALPASIYLVTATNIAGIEIWRRWWTAPFVADAACWLDAQASSDDLISARPWSTAHILLRGLRPEGYAHLAAEHRVAAAVADGAGLIEVWITLADRPVGARVAARVAAELAARSGGDLLTTDARSVGHLPGLPHAASADGPGGAPAFTRLLAASRGPDPRAAAIAIEATAALGCALVLSPPIQLIRFRDRRRKQRSLLSPARPLRTEAQRGRR
ncbi:hypothetical protein [Falsiroseomonas sp. E2-1-a20]|uniref:hypothetical protein n=1 Tax=Falsiroseomonas sp. E2-1-a20 TaxID=3239300 RepID=UPI003F37A134